MARDAVVPADASLHNLSQFDQHTVIAVKAEENRHYVGRRIGEIAAEEGRTPIDVMIGIAVADDLDTVLTPDLGGDDRASYELRGRIWADDRTLVGASDAGAHLDMVDSFAFTTIMLEDGVRNYKVISLEQAIHKLTQRPAEYFGIVERGVIAKGFHADLIVFDAATVGPEPVYNRYDLPGGQDYRIYAEARGIDHVFVNGTEIVRRGEHTGKLPGKVLRSGRDTKTVSLDALRIKEAA
jgi:N-acyl-D-aspartate/D-glutamate deacylase